VVVVGATDVVGATVVAGPVVVVGALLPLDGRLSQAMPSSSPSRPLGSDGSASKTAWASSWNAKSEQLRSLCNASTSPTELDVVVVELDVVVVELDVVVVDVEVVVVDVEVVGVWAIAGLAAPMVNKAARIRVRFTGGA
jgi:hypothetical protein